MGTLVLEPAAAVKQEEATLSRRPTLVRKREEAELDGSLLVSPSSPSKKAKVTFSDNDQIRILTDDERPPDSLREDVRLTLKKYEHGDSADYAKLLAVFEKEDEDVASIPDRKQGLAMTGYTAALSAHVSLLKRSYERLVHAILGSCWAARDDRAAEVHVQFLRHLVSSRTQWTPDVLKSIISGFTNSVVDDDLLAEAGTPRTVYEQRLHLALLHINETVPSSMSHLAPLLRSEFPPPSSSQKQHGIYVHNLLTIIKYTPQLRAEILSIITERTVEVDAQVQADLEDLTEDVGDDVIEKIAGSQYTELSELNDEDDEDDDVDDDFDGQELFKQKLKARNIARTIGKVDILLDSSFRYYNDIFASPEMDTHTKALESLIAQFKASILPSSRSRHAQFLLFRFSQTSAAYVDIFLGVLLEIIIDERQQSTIRQAAAAYLGSYIARGEHVEAQVVRDTFDFVSVQLSQYRQRYESRCTGPDLQKYPVYYSLMQALIYIFCFRWRDLELKPDDSPSSSNAYFTATTPRNSPPTHTFVRGIKETFTSNIFSRFNPLKVCHPDIVGEFARMAHALDLIWVFGKIETNLRIRLGGTISSTERETALSSRKDESLWQLEAYFPFDPYTLPRSRKWVDGDYRLWNGEVEGERKYVEGLNNLDSDDESDDDSEDEINGSDNDDEDDNAH